MKKAARGVRGLQSAIACNNCQDHRNDNIKCAKLISVAQYREYASMIGCPVHAPLNDLKLCVHMLSLSGIFLLLLLVNFENREQLSVKAYMT